MSEPGFLQKKLPFRDLLLSGGLATWAILLFYLILGKGLASFLHPSFRLPVILAACALIVMALALILLPQPDEEDSCDCCERGPLQKYFPQLNAPQHTHGVKAWKLAAVLLPVCLSSLIQQEGYSMDTMYRRGILEDPQAMQGLYQYADSEQTAPAPATEENNQDLGPSAAEYLDSLDKTADGAWELPVTDLLYAMEEPPLRDLLVKGRIEVIGQRVPANRNNPHGNRLMLIRMMIVCCAADARPVGVLAEFPKGIPEGKDMDWIQLTGRIQYPKEQGKYIAVFIVDSCKSIPEPEEPFIY